MLNNGGGSTHPNTEEKNMEKVIEHFNKACQSIASGDISFAISEIKNAKALVSDVKKFEKNEKFKEARDSTENHVMAYADATILTYGLAISKHPDLTSGIHQLYDAWLTFTSNNENKANICNSAGTLYSNQNEQKKALPLCTMAVALDATNYVYALNCAIVNKKLGYYEEAIKHVVACLFLKPNCADARLLLADISKMTDKNAPPPPDTKDYHLDNSDLLVDKVIVYLKAVGEQLRRSEVILAIKEIRAAKAFIGEFEENTKFKKARALAEIEIINFMNTYLDEIKAQGIENAIHSRFEYDCRLKLGEEWLPLANQDGTRANLLNSIGIFYLGLKQNENALRQFEAAVKLDKTNKLYLTNCTAVKDHIRTQNKLPADMGAQKAKNKKKNKKKNDRSTEIDLPIDSNITEAKTAYRKAKESVDESEDKLITKNQKFDKIINAIKLCNLALEKLHKSKSPHELSEKEISGNMTECYETLSDLMNKETNLVQQNEFADKILQVSDSCNKKYVEFVSKASLIHAYLAKAQQEKNMTEAIKFCKKALKMECSKDNSALYYSNQAKELLEDLNKKIETQRKEKEKQKLDSDNDKLVQLETKATDVLENAKGIKSAFLTRLDECKKAKKEMEALPFDSENAIEKAENIQKKTVKDDKQPKTVLDVESLRKNLKDLSLNHPERRYAKNKISAIAQLIEKVESIQKETIEYDKTILSLDEELVKSKQAIATAVKLSREQELIDADMLKLKQLEDAVEKEKSDAANYRKKSLEKEKSFTDYDKRLKDLIPKTELNHKASLKRLKEILEAKKKYDDKLAPAIEVDELSLTLDKLKLDRPKNDRVQHAINNIKNGIARIKTIQQDTIESSNKVEVLNAAINDSSEKIHSMREAALMKEKENLKLVHTIIPKQDLDFAFLLSKKYNLEWIGGLTLLSLLNAPHSEELAKKIVVKDFDAFIKAKTDEDAESLGLKLNKEDKFAWNCAGAEFVQYIQGDQKAKHFEIAIQKPTYKVSKIITNFNVAKLRFLTDQDFESKKFVRKNFDLLSIGGGRYIGIDKTYLYYKDFKKACKEHNLLVAEYDYTIHKKYFLQVVKNTKKMETIFGTISDIDEKVVASDNKTILINVGTLLKNVDEIFYTGLSSLIPAQKDACYLEIDALIKGVGFTDPHASPYIKAFLKARIILKYNLDQQTVVQRICDDAMVYLTKHYYDSGSFELAIDAVVRDKHKYINPPPPPKGGYTHYFYQPAPVVVQVNKIENAKRLKKPTQFS